MKNIYSRYLFTGTTGVWKKAYYNGQTNLQLAVVKSYLIDEINTSYWTDFVVCIPSEAPTGFRLKCNSLEQAHKIVERECSLFGKFINRANYLTSKLVNKYSISKIDQCSLSSEKNVQ